MLSLLTFLGCVALLFLQGAQTETVKLLEYKHEQCELDRLQRNFIHAVTCFGFARVPLKYHSYESLNAKIDGILEAAKKQREAGGKEVNCSTHSVTPLYYSATELLFVRYPKVHKGDKLKDDQRDVSFWITKVDGLVNQFVNFPESKNWSVIGKGYWNDKYNTLSSAQREKAICDPQHVRHNVRDKKIEFGLSGKQSVQSGSAKLSPQSGDCAINVKGEYSRYDPKLVDSKFYKNRGTRLEERNNYFYNQIYELQTFSSRREKYGYDQYYFVFGEVEQALVDSVLAGNIWHADIKSHCYLRKFRHDLGELNVAYILPQDAKTRIITDGKEFLKTTTLSTTTSSTTTSSTTTSSTTTVSTTSKVTTMPTTKRRMETTNAKRTTIMERESEVTPVLGTNTEEPIVKLEEFELPVQKSSSIGLGIFAFFIFAVEILL